MNNIHSKANNFPLSKKSLIHVVIAMVYALLYQIFPNESIHTLLSIIFLGYLFLCDTKTSFFQLMFIISANEMLNVGTTSVAMIYMMLYAVKSVFYKIASRNTSILVSVFLSGASLILFSFIMFISGSTEQLNNSVKCILFLYYISQVLKDSKGNFSDLYVNAFRYIALGINFFSFTSLFFYGATALSSRFTFSPDVTINFLGITCALSIVNLFYGMHVLRTNNKAFDIMLMLGCTLWGLLTQSRSFILSVTVSIILMLILSNSAKKTIKLVAILTSLLAMLIILAATVPFINSLFYNTINRILNPTGDDISNGRYVLWEQTVDAMLEKGRYIFFGMGDYTLANATFEGKVLVAHNVVIETWVIFGIVGCVLLYFLFSSVIREYVFCGKRVRIKLISLVPLITMLGAFTFSHHFIGRSTSLVFVLSFIPIYLASLKNTGDSQ